MCSWVVFYFVAFAMPIKFKATGVYLAAVY